MTTDTIGNTDSSGSFYYGFVSGGAITASASGTLSTLGINMHTATGHGRLALYSTYSSSKFSGLIAETASVSLSVGWNDVAVAGGTITASTTYYIAFQNDAAGDDPYQMGGGNRYYTSTAYGAFPDPTGNMTADAVAVINLRMTYTAPPKYPYIEQISNVDSVADIGTHSAFANQQSAADSTYDTLTEADTDTGTSQLGDTSGSGSSYRTTAADEVRMQVVTAASTGEVASIVFYGRYNSTGSTNAKAIITDSSGNLLTNGVGAATSVSATAGTKTLTYTAGSRPIVVSGTTYWIGFISQAAIRLYYDSTTGGTMKQDTTNSYTTPTSPTDAGGTTETWRLMYANINNLNYELQLEEQFTTVPAGELHLHITTGAFSSPAETLNLEVRDGASWTSLGALTASADNDLGDISSYVSSSTLTIRFHDGTTTNDAVQSTWQIDSVRLTPKYTQTYSFGTEPQAGGSHTATYTFGSNPQKLGILQTYTFGTQPLKNFVTSTYSFGTSPQKLGILKTYTFASQPQAVGLLKTYTFGSQPLKNITQTYLFGTNPQATGLLKTYTFGSSPQKNLTSLYSFGTEPKALTGNTATYTFGSDAQVTGLLLTYTFGTEPDSGGILGGDSTKYYYHQTPSERIDLTVMYLIKNFLEETQ